MRPSQTTTKNLTSLITRSLLPRTTTLSVATPARGLSNLATLPLRNRPLQTLKPVLHSIRAYSSDNKPIDTSPLTDRQATPEQDAQTAEANRLRREQEPAYQIVFTCKPCGHRSAHRMSKQGYHRGTVVIRCPSCKNRHVMSDHLKIFFDKSSTLDEILGERGGKVTRGYLEGDMEFWEDGSVTKAQGSENADAKGEGEAKKLS